MVKHGSMPTDELIRLAIIGDGAAFTHLWDENIDTLRCYIKSKMKNLDDFYVDDICSKSFEKAFRQIRTYDPAKSQFSTWLMTIARNTALFNIFDFFIKQNIWYPIFYAFFVQFIFFILFKTKYFFII